MRSYRPEEHFDDDGRLVPELAALAPEARPADGRQPARQRRPPAASPLDAPRLRRLRGRRRQRRAPSAPSRRGGSASCCATCIRDNAEHANFRLFCPDETNSNRLGAVFEVEDRCLHGRRARSDEHVSPDGRVMEVLCEHNCQGWLEGYLLTGRHGLFATYEAFAMVSASMAIQHAKWLEEPATLDVAAAGRLAERAADLDLLAQRPQRVQPPGPGAHRHDDLQARRGRPRLLAARRELPALGRRPLPAQPRLRQPDRDRQAAAAAVPRHRRRRAEHCAPRRLASGTGRAPTPTADPDVVLACAGDIPTLETLAAAWLLREHVPELTVRVVNVVDLMALFPPEAHPHGMTRRAVRRALHGATTEVVFAFHGYAARDAPAHPRAPAPRPLPRPRLHRAGDDDDPVRHGRAQRDEPLPPGARGAATAPGATRTAPTRCETTARRCSTATTTYVREHLEDMPEIRDWTWAG